MTVDRENPYAPPSVSAEGQAAPNIPWQRMKLAVALTLLFAGIGVLAPYVPNLWVGFRFAWVATCYVVGMGALSGGSRVDLVRVGLGLIAGAALSYFFVVMIDYNYDQDLMRPREWKVFILPYVSLFGAIPAIFPAYQMLTVEGKQKVREAGSRGARVLAGARIGLLQSAVVALIFSPFIFVGMLEPVVSSRNSDIPVEILSGPHNYGHLPFFFSILMTFVISGTLCGAMAGLFCDIQRQGDDECVMSD